MSKKGKTHYIKYNWISDDPRLIAKARELAELRNAGLTRKSKRPFEDAFNVILTSFEVLDAYGDYDLRIPTNTTLYKGNGRRNPTYTSEILDALKFLIQNLYLVKVSDVKKVTHGYKVTWLPISYSITSEWLDNIAPQPLSNPTLIRRNPLLPYTELRQDFGKGKNRVKRAIPIPPVQKEVHAEMLAKTDQVLKAYDEMMRASKVTLGDTVIHPAQLSCTRIFRQRNPNQGRGRPYNFIQNKPEEVRVHINLNDEPTIEIDYWSIHPFLAYHQKGASF